MKYSVANGKASSKSAIIVGILFVVPYILGWLLPDMWWGTHFIAFLPDYLRWSILMVGILVMVGTKYLNFQIVIDKVRRTQINFGLLLPILLALISAVFYWKSPIALDIYGDAFRFITALHKVEHTIPEQAVRDIFSLRFAPWDGELTILGILAHLSYYLQLTWGQLFQGMSILFGSLFTFIYARFVLKSISSPGWKLLLIICGLASPFTLIFHQHFEIYAPIYFFQFVWFLKLLSFTKEPSRGSLAWLIVITFINLKLHTVTVLMFPVLLLAILRNFYPENKRVIKALNWKSITQWIFVPISIIGLITYFFVLQDHIDDRNLTTTSFEYDHLFLPLFSPQPPLDQYNILGFNHIFDYVNLIFHGVPIALMVIVYLLIRRRKDFHDDHDVLLIGTTSILYFALFFVVNPLLSMPRDWDLLNLSVPSILVLCIVMARKIENTESARWPLAFSCVMVAMSSAIFSVNANPSQMGQRLESLTIWNHQTYYEWTTLLSRYRMQVGSLTAQEQIEIREGLISRLKPNSIPKVDREYAAILRDQGLVLLKSLNAPAAALPYFEEAYEYFPSLKANLELLVETHFSLDKYSEAYQYALQLVQHRYPSESRAHNMALHCALEAEFYQEAQVHCLRLIELEPDNKIAHTILSRLRNKEHVEKLKYLFARPSVEN